MMGDKKLSEIREEVRAAMRAQGLASANVIASLDARIRELRKNGGKRKPSDRSLLLLRGALAQLEDAKPQKRRRSRSKKIV